MICTLKFPELGFVGDSFRDAVLVVNTEWCKNSGIVLFYKISVYCNDELPWVSAVFQSWASYPNWNPTTPGREPSNVGSCSTSPRGSHQHWLIWAPNLQTQSLIRTCQSPRYLSREVITKLLELKLLKVSTLVLDMTHPHLFSWNDVLIPLQCKSREVEFSFILSQQLSPLIPENQWDVHLGRKFSSDTVSQKTTMVLLRANADEKEVKEQVQERALGFESDRCGFKA